MGVMSAIPSVQNLFSTDFPIYAIEITPAGHALVAGGGGSAKTGVPNAIVSLHQQRLCRAHQQGERRGGGEGC